MPLPTWAHWPDATHYLNAENMLQTAMAAAVQWTKRRYAFDPGVRYQSDQPLKLLLAGYNGTRNTGADVRVEEIVRQLWHIFGKDKLELNVLTQDLGATRGYFEGARQTLLPRVFPKFLVETVHQHHGVLAVEGSMFKSRFANALTVMMTGALGAASAENKLSVAYGGEAGNMDPSLKRFVRNYAKDSFIIVRNPQSVDVLRSVGLNSVQGTDTAWTFDPGSDEKASRLLVEAGWDGRQPIVTVCPIHGFWWPVKPDLFKAALRYSLGSYKKSHYGSIYFHNLTDETERKQQLYLDALAAATTYMKENHQAFPVIIGMEALDRKSCEQLGKRLGFRTPIFVSDDHNMFTMVNLLRKSQYMLSSRFHAMVTSMPAGVVSAGVSMDERIINLLEHRGDPSLGFMMEEDQLKDRLISACDEMVRYTDRIRTHCEKATVQHLETLGQMGLWLFHHLKAQFPEFPTNPKLEHSTSPWDFLPPLNDSLLRLVEMHRTDESVRKSFIRMPEHHDGNGRIIDLPTGPTNIAGTRRGSHHVIRKNS